MLIEKLYVHAGRPHLDNAYCAFIAETLGGKTIRVNTLPEDVDVFNYIGIIAADIGGGVYDHHGYDTPKRKDGYTHCAASLMWKWFGIDVVKAPIKLQKELIEKSSLQSPHMTTMRDPMGSTPSIKKQIPFYQRGMNLPARWRKHFKTW